MQKLFALGGLAALALVLHGCGGGGGDTTTPAPTPAPSPKPTPKPTPAPTPKPGTCMATITDGQNCDNDANLDQKPTLTQDECCKFCADNIACGAWTWNKDIKTDPKQTCYLKKDCKLPSKEAGLVSGKMPAPPTFAIPMNAVNFEGGLRLTVNVNPKGDAPQEALLDTGSSTLAFCNASLEASVIKLKTDYMTCNKYGSGNEGFWGYFYKGPIGIGKDLIVDDIDYSVMHQEVSMPCGKGLQGIFGVAFKELNEVSITSKPLNWPKGGVGDCPRPTADLVGPLMSYLKMDTPEGRLGIYWSGAVKSAAGELYIGASAENNAHYKKDEVQIATLGETGYYDITINKFFFDGQSHAVQCDPKLGAGDCLVDTGTPIMFVPQAIYTSIMAGKTGSLEMQLAGPDGPIKLEFDAATLAKNNYLQPYQEGGPFIIGLPLWAFYYTVFNIKGRSMSFVKHPAAELASLKNQKTGLSTVVV